MEEITMQQNEPTMYYTYIYILQMQSMACVYWHKPCARDFKSKRLTFKQLNQMGKHNADIVFRHFFDLNSDAISWAYGTSSMARQY